MNFNDEVDWPERFGEYISNSSLADPNRKPRKYYVVTMLFFGGRGQRNRRPTLRAQLAWQGRTWMGENFPIDCRKAC